MKKLLLMLGLVFVLSGISFAEEEKFDTQSTSEPSWKKSLSSYTKNMYNHTHTVTIEKEDKVDALGSLDMPLLVRLTKNLYLGTEIIRDIRNNDIEQGWTGIAKITYVGTLFSLYKENK